jgi:hypothetical protein
MRNLVRAVALVLVATGVAATAEPQAVRQSLNSYWGQVWGTYVWQTQMGSGNLLPALITFHVDGTITGSDGSMFGALNPKIRTTPLHGVWERTGWQSIGGTSLYVVFDATTGAVMKYGRARSSLQFAGDFNSFKGKIFIESLICATPLTCPNPLDPAAKWDPNPTMPFDGFTVTGQRLERIAAAPRQQ